MLSIRTITVASVAVAFAPACFWSDHHVVDNGDDYDPTPGPEPDAPDAAPWEWPSCDPCPDSTHVGFGTGPLELAVGTTLTRYFDGEGAYAIRSDDPTVAAVIAVSPSDERMVIDTRRAGTANIIAYRQSDNLEIARLAVVAHDVAGAAFWPRTSPVPGQPVTAVAGLVGASDTIGITFVDAGGAELDGEGVVRVDGTAASLGPADVFRLSEVLEPRARYGVVFDELGTASIVTRLADGREFAAPIQVVAAPATLEVVAMVTNADYDLLPAPAVIDSSYLAGIDVIGRTATGRIVEGVTATFTATAGVHALGDLAVPDTELVFQLDPGTSTITATAGSLTVTTTLVAQ